MEAGPYSDVDEAEVSLSHMSTIAKPFDVLTFSGSLPKRLATHYYQDLMTMATFKQLYQQLQVREVSHDNHSK